MSRLKYIDKQHMINLFGIKGGYVFSYLKNGYSKTTTRDMILDSTGIDIYNNPNYDLSQEKCIRKIWEECDDVTNGRLLQTMLDYFDTICDWSLGRSDEIAYTRLRELEKELLSSSCIQIPQSNEDSLQLIYDDIERNVANNSPELILDRLHTFTTKYIRTLCDEHAIQTTDDKGNGYPLHSLIGNLKNWYRDNNYFDSEFCLVAIQNSINIFSKYNDIRNNQSAAHPNQFLNRIEAEYAVKIVSDTLMFIDKIEKLKKEEKSEAPNPWLEDIETIDFDDENLPF